MSSSTGTGLMFFGSDSAHRFVPVAAGLLNRRAFSSAWRMIDAVTFQARRAWAGVSGPSPNHSSAVRTSILKPVTACSNRPVGGPLLTQWAPGFQFGVWTYSQCRTPGAGSGRFPVSMMRLAPYEAAVSSRSVRLGFLRRSPMTGRTGVPASVTPCPVVWSTQIVGTSFGVHGLGR